MPCRQLCSNTSTELCGAFLKQTVKRLHSGFDEQKGSKGTGRRGVERRLREDAGTEGRDNESRDEEDGD